MHIFVEISNVRMEVRNVRTEVHNVHTDIHLNEMIKGQCGHNCLHEFL